MAKDICETCGQEEPKSGVKKRGKKKDQTVGWISCDGCKKWFHTVCVRISNLLLQEIDNHWYFCEKCTILGTLIQKQTPALPPCTNPSSCDLTKVTSTISELSEKLAKLQAELEGCRLTCRRSTDKLRSQLLSLDQIHDRNSAQHKLVSSIEKKIEVIESGARLANTCVRSVNDFRIAINKIPFREGENVKILVQSALISLGVEEADAPVASCFRVPPRASKWSDRSVSPTIIVVFNSKEAKDKVLKQYFENFTRATLSSLRTGLALEYRFTVNEVLSVPTFKIRNLALRLKHRKLIASVFVRNDSVSVRLPNQKRYISITSCDQLVELTNPIGDDIATADESSIFFDAVSADGSASSRQ